MLFLKRSGYIATIILIFFCTPSISHGANKSLKERIDRILSNTCSQNASMGIKIVNMNTKETLYERNSKSLLLPASNLKLLTSAAALKNLYPDYRFKTTLSTDGKIENGVLKGNLYIKGFGDPKLVSEEIWMIVKDLYNRGIREITGDIIGDNSFFDKKKTGNGWGKRLTSRAYHAKIGALSVNFNTVAIHIEPSSQLNSPPTVVIDPKTSYIEVVNNAVTTARAKRSSLVIDRVALKNKDRIIVTGKIARGIKRKTYYRNISYPIIYSLNIFKEFMEQYGILVKGSLSVMTQPENVKKITIHKSVPLSLIIRGLNKMSNNFTAEQVLKTMGAELKGIPGTTESGLEVVKLLLDDVGIPKDSYVLADGSGLSILNRFTANQFIKVLTYIYNDFIAGPEYISSLGVMGVDGSVKDRLNKSAAHRMIRAKTGTLDGVTCISGYGKKNSGDTIAFSILANNVKCNPNTMIDLQDRVLLEALR